MGAVDLKGLLAAGGDEHERWARTINPQFVRVLRTIGFDRTWVRADGAYLFDADGNRYLDMLGGFGMYNVGRNNPRIRAALVEALELETPGSVQLGVTSLPGLLAEALLRRTPARLERVLFTSSGTEAVEAALKLGRAATKRARVLSAEHGFHGLTLGSLSANGKTLAARGEQNLAVRLWDVTTGKELPTPEGQADVPAEDGLFLSRRTP